MKGELMTVLILNYENSIITKYIFYPGDSDFENRVVIETYFKPGDHMGKEMAITFRSEDINN